MPHDIDEDFLERALRRAQIAEADAGFRQIAQQGGDAGPLGLRVVGVDQLVAVSGERQVMALQAPGMESSGSCSSSVRRFLPSLRIRVDFSSTTMSSPLLMTPMRSAISSASSM